MKFRLAVFLVIFLAISACTSFNYFSPDIKETGAWGPIVIKADKNKSKYFLAQIKNPFKEFELKLIKKNDLLLLYPIAPLEIGQSYQLLKEGKNEPIVERINIAEPCLSYLGDPGGKSEIWKKCPGKEPIQLTMTNGKVIDYTVSRFGDWVFFIKPNEIGGTEIWKIKSDGRGNERIFDCSGYQCSDLEYNPVIGKLAFIQASGKPQIKILDLETKTVNEIGSIGSELDFSPDGKFLSYLDNESGQLTLIELATMKKIAFPSGAGLVGDWAEDSHSILFGALDYWGGIPGVKVFELDINSKEITPVLYDPNQDLEFYQPKHTGDKGVYLTSVRQRSAGPSKQLWLLSDGAKGVKQITNDPLFHYSFPSWKSDFSELAFQRYPINKSEGNPQVLIWNKSTDTFQMIAENGSKPLWLP